jgi:hypothetical protein
MTGGYTLLVADLIGVAVFAASGASAAVAKRLDLFGVAFVGFVAVFWLHPQLTRWWSPWAAPSRSRSANGRASTVRSRWAVRRPR